MVAFLVHYDITIIREIVFNEKTIILLKHVMKYLFLFFFFIIDSHYFCIICFDTYFFSFNCFVFLFLFFLTI